MQLTVIGSAELAVALALYAFGSIRAFFLLFMGMTLFGGSAAITLTALGGPSISPAHFALGLLVLRCIAPGGLRSGEIRAAIRANRWLVVFASYGVLAAFVLPHIFAGRIDVTPLRGPNRASYGTPLARILATEPLHFTTQNMTTAIYLAGTLIAALSAHTVLRRAPNGGLLLARAGSIIAAAHAFSGFAGLALHNTAGEAVFRFFRNGSYAQLDHEWGGFVRMNGLWPEASSFASFALVWFAFTFECWLRRMEPRLTGPASLLLTFALIASTSSTAYIGLALFGALLTIRMLITPRLMALDRLALFAMIGLGAITAGTALLLLEPALAAAMGQLFEHMTMDKPGSFSGQQRLFWARQGIAAFTTSHTLGIGPGSFRSSSLATAILGSTGLIGACAFMLHLARAFAPLAASTWHSIGDPDRDVAAAAAWAMLIGIGVASVSSPSCDPGLTFGVLSGGAIALRSGSTSTPRRRAFEFTKAVVHA